MACSLVVSFCFCCRGRFCQFGFPLAGVQQLFLLVRDQLSLPNTVEWLHSEVPARMMKEMKQ